MSNMQKLSVLTLMLLSLQVQGREKHTLFLTYSQHTFLYAPGVTWMSGVGTDQSVLSLYMGVGVHFQQIDFDRVVNTTNQYRFNFQHIDAGFVYHLFRSGPWDVGLLAGAKLYYGPHYLPVATYQQAGHTIYYDASGMRIDMGVDLGITTTYHRFTGLVKFDTARKHLRAGLGFRFGKMPTSPAP